MRDQRNLRIRDVRVALLMLPAHQVVDILHAHFDRFRGGALQLGIERRVDAQRLECATAPGRRHPLRQLVMHQVDEVRRFARIDAGVGEAQRLSLGAIGLRLR